MAMKSSSGFWPPEAKVSTTKKRRNVVESSEDKSVKHKKSRFEIDHCKKLQCSVMLKLMAHRYGWAFTHPAHPKPMGFDDAKSKPMDLNTIKSKLEKGLYEGTDEFAGDVYEMLSDATMCYHRNHEIHRTANKFKDDFEMRWKSLKQSWANEKAKKKKKEEEIQITNKSEPSRKLNLNVKLKLSQSNTTNEQHTNKPVNAFTYVAQCNGKAKKHFLDTILASQDSLLGFGHKAEKETRKKEREAARMAIEKMERTVCVNEIENLTSIKELERLCGHSLSHSNSSNALQHLGLVLKDEWMNRWDEDLFLNRDWEEGQIIL